MGKNKQRRIIDMVPWCEANHVLDDGSLIKFQPHQRKLFNRIFTPDADGRLPYQTYLFSRIKKSGKTEELACTIEWFAFEFQPGGEYFCLANDEEQSVGRVFQRIKRSVSKNPRLMNRVDSMTRSEIVLKDGGVIKAVASEYAGSAGASPDITTWDELWAYSSERSRRLWDETTPVPTKLNSIRVIGTYAGFEDESELLWELYQRGKAGKRIWSRMPCWENGKLFMIWDHKPRMSWQTPEYYATQKEELRLSAFLRMHLNQWVSTESGLFDMQKWDTCVDPEHSPPLPDTYKGVRLWVGCDASTKRDRTAVVSVYSEGGKIKLGPKRFWTPSKSDPMDLEQSVEKYLLELSQGYTLVAVYYDPYQLHRSATTLQYQGLPMIEYPQTSGNLTEVAQNLFDLVEYGNIVLYPDKEMRKEAASAVAKETTRGLRITKEKSTAKIDQIVSLALACLGASKEVEYTGEAKIFTKLSSMYDWTGAANVQTLIDLGIIDEAERHGGDWDGPGDVAFGLHRGGDW